MEIREERNWIEVRVDRKEMQGYGLTFEALEPGSQKMERMMGEILSRVWEETELDLFHSGLQIRAFPLDGGCRLFLKRKRGQKHRRREAEPAAADFESWADLCRGCGVSPGKRCSANGNLPDAGGVAAAFMGKGQPGACPNPAGRTVCRPGCAVSGSSRGVWGAVSLPQGSDGGGRIGSAEDVRACH